MKITLTQPEIEQAVRQYVGGMVSLRENTQMQIDFTAGRGDNGLSASIEINYMAVTGLPEVAASAKTAAPQTATPVTETPGPVMPDAEPEASEPAAAPPAKAGKTLFGTGS